MSITLTVAQMKAMGTGASKPALLSAIADVITNDGSKFFLDTANRVIHFLGQVAWESGYFTLVEESLNYSAKRMMAVWPTRFKTLESAAPYANNPRALANFVYGSRMGNKAGTDDGYKFRGRGIKQLTGRENYTLFNKWVHTQYPDAPDFVKNPDMVAQLPWAVLSGVWYWVKNKVYQYADKDDATAVTKAINGGTIGLKERTVATNKARSIIIDVKPSVLKEKKPSKPDQVLKSYQAKLKEIADYKKLPELDPGKIDGWHGAKTEAAITAFEKNAGIKVNGILDDETKLAIDNVIAVIQVGKETTIADDLEDAETPTPTVEPEEVPVSIPNKLVDVLDKPIVQGKSLWALITGGGAFGTFFYNTGIGLVNWFNNMDPIVQVTILVLSVIAIYLLIANVRDFWRARKGLKELKKNNREALENATE